MKFSRLLCVTVSLMMLISFGWSKPVLASDISWHSYDEGLALAKEKHKKVYLNFYADWCGYCKKMEKETYVNQDVVKYLNDHYVSIRLNSDKEQKLSRKYNVQGLPANFFMTEKGEPIGSQPGYMGPKDFMKVLSFVYEEKYKSGSK